MDREQYASVQGQLVALAAVVQRMPLKEFLLAIDKADTLGPILDPTLYLRGSRQMHDAERLARALLPFQQEISKVLHEKTNKPPGPCLRKVGQGDIPPPREEKG